MVSSPYEIGDVILVRHQDQEVSMKILGLIDSLDDTKPLLCVTRTKNGRRWRSGLSSWITVEVSKIVVNDNDVESHTCRTKGPNK